SGLQEFKDEWSVILRIEQLGLRSSEIDHILMTHLHFDHTGGMKELIHARFHVAHKEWVHALGMSSWEAKRNGYAVRDFRALEGRVDTFETLPYFDPREPGVDLFGDGSVLAIGLPGHAPGHTGYLFSLSDGQQIFFLGDAVFNLAHVEGTDDLGFIPRQFASDLGSVRVTVDELRRYRAAHPEITYLCSHDFGWGAKCMSGPLRVS
ncbi:MAG: MBL fold metallo-hydrolase, partial [Myxococcota bacterium]